MKYLYYLWLVPSLLLMSCKKDTVDGSSVKNFQESINSMATSLNTLEQTKFNEALYVLKTFEAKGETDMQRLEDLARLISGKNVKQIFSLADEVAHKNNVDWSSTAPPSLGEMNIFQNITATETDPNDISAQSLDMIIKPVQVDSVMGVQSIRVIPKLLDNVGKEVLFSNAALEAVMEVFSDGNRLLTAKNVITNNNFKGFHLKMASLPSDKVVDSSIDIKISVKTTQKTYQFLKTGIPVSEKSLKPVVEDEEHQDESLEGEAENKAEVAPKNIVGKFLNNLNNNNLKEAYAVSENPVWGSFDKFSNSASGFGGIAKVNIERINEKRVSDKNAEVNAIYQVVDKDGNITHLDASYGLKKTENGWKITNYRINSSEKK